MTQPRKFIALLETEILHKKSVQASPDNDTHLVTEYEGDFINNY